MKLDHMTKLLLALLLTSCAPTINNITPAVETESVREYFDFLDANTQVNVGVNLYDQRTGLTLQCQRVK